MAISASEIDIEHLLWHSAILKDMLEMFDLNLQQKKNINEKKYIN